MATLAGGTGRMSEAHMGTVIKNSEEWAFVEYMLQINTRTSRVKLLQAWHVAPPHVVNQFEKRTSVSPLTCIKKHMHSLQNHLVAEPIQSR